MSQKLVDRLGIQSWCFRKYKELEPLLTDLKSCGVDRLEICGAHVNVLGDTAGAIQACRNAGVVLSGFGVYTFGPDEAKCRAAFEFAAAADIPVISAHIELEALDMLERLCEEYGKKLAHHNHGRKHRYGSLTMIDDIFRRSSPNIGLCLDTAWMLDSGEDPLAVAHQYRERLYGLHLKDFVFDRAGKPSDVVVGTGNLDLPGLAHFLDEIEYDGYLTIEYEGDVDNPVPALQSCVKDVKAALLR